MSLTIRKPIMFADDNGVPYPAAGLFKTTIMPDGYLMAAIGVGSAATKITNDDKQILLRICVNANCYYKLGDDSVVVSATDWHGYITEGNVDIIPVQNGETYIALIAGSATTGNASLMVVAEREA